MKILIIDRDEMFMNLLGSKIRAAGHEVIESTMKQDGIDQIGAQHVDAVYFDPAPLSDARSILLQIRRMVRSFPYLVMMGHDLTETDGVRAGCNTALAKPLDPAALAKTLQNAERMGSLVKRLNDPATDFPSAGGVIAKSAFNQLFLSAIDRVSRYEETSRALFIGIANYEDLKIDEGRYAADLAVSKLAQNLSRLRRQSDILAQTDVHEYALLLQRPQNENEAVDAARRFASVIESMTDLVENIHSGVQVDISLVNLPDGTLEFQHVCKIYGHGAGSMAAN